VIIVIFQPIDGHDVGVIQGGEEATMPPEPSD